MSDDQPTRAAAVQPGAAEPGVQAQARAFRWGPWATLAWTAAIAAITFLAVGFLAMGIAGIRAVSDPSSGSFPEILTRVVDDQLATLTAAQAIISALMVLFLTRRMGELTRTRMLGLGPMGLRRLTVATAGILVAIFVFTELPQILLGISDRGALKWITGLTPQWLAILLLVAIAPVSEELLFRGFIYGGLAASAIGPVGAIVLTSTVWAVIHVQYAWPIMAQIFIYGVIFGIARWRSGSLWPSITAHAMINLYAAVVAFSAFSKAA